MKKIISTLLVIVLISGSLIGQDIPKQPQPPRLVNDFANILSPNQVNVLERKLVAFNDTNSTQITIVTVGTLDGYDVSDYAQRLGQDWGIGRKEYDNGVLILLQPKTADLKGEVDIDVGYGMEPIIPDITAKRIIENEMIPHFKNNDYYGGLNAATDVIIDLAAGQFSAEEYQQQSEGGSLFGFLVPIIVMIIIFTMINRSRKRQYTAGGTRSSSLPFWVALGLLGSMGSGRSGSSFGNFSSGGGSFGGGGSSFGGFGGGSFGGGGASGSW
jgi:uncharacterized protein